MQAKLRGSKAAHHFSHADQVAMLEERRKNIDLGCCSFELGYSLHGNSPSLGGVIGPALPMGDGSCGAFQGLPSPTASCAATCTTPANVACVGAITCVGAATAIGAAVAAIRAAIDVGVVVIDVGTIVVAKSA